MISTKGLSVIYNDDRGSSISVLDNLSVNVQKGEILGILGPSGCGKSTLLRCLAGIIAPSKGAVYFQGKQVKFSKLHTDKKISLMFQQPYLLPWLTIKENIVFPAKIGKNVAYSEQKLNRLLQITDLVQWQEDYPDQLSQGMKQRATIARSLLLDPAILLLDEPFSALDDFTRLHLATKLHDILRQTHTTTVLVSHDVEEALYLCDRIMILSHKPTHVLQEYVCPRGEHRSLGLLQKSKFQEMLAYYKNFILHEAY